MKKVLSLLLSGLVVFMMFGFGGGSVLAAESTDSGKASLDNDSCWCHDFTMLAGAERNKVVANLLKTDEFNNTLKEAIAMGYNWDGAGSVQVVKYNQPPLPGASFVGVKVSFTNKKGESIELGFLFVNGELYPPKENK